MAEQCKGVLLHRLSLFTCGLGRSSPKHLGGTVREWQLPYRAALPLEQGSEESSLLTEVTQHTGQYTEQAAGGSHRQGENADRWQ